MFWILISAIQAKSLADIPSHSIQQKIGFRYINKAAVPGIIPGDNLASTLVGTVQIGTPSQSMSVLFDTGSKLFWLRSARCSSVECIGKPTFDSQKSTTFQRLFPQSNRTIVYADGTRISCTLNSDAVSLGGLVLQNQTFCEATDIRTEVASTDGVLGLGPPSLARNTSAFFDSFLSRTNREPVFSFWYNRNETIMGNGDAGEIFLGGIDTTKFKDPILYTNLTQDRNYWNVELQSLTVNSKNVLASSARTMVDTGTTLVLLPKELFDNLTAHMPKLQVQKYFYIDCKKVKELPPINVTFTGMPPLTLTWDQQILVDAEQNSCLSIFQPIQGDVTNLGMIFGALFLRQFYTVFDYGRERVGFGVLPSMAPQVPNSAFGIAINWLLVFILVI